MPLALNPVTSSASATTMRFTWVVLSRAAADLDLVRAGLAVAARGPVLVEDGPAKAMAMAVVVLAAALVAMD